MNSSEDNKKKESREIPDSSTKTARGSKKVHSELDNSQEDGWKPNNDND